MEIYSTRTAAAENAVHRTIVQVEKPECALVTSHSFVGRDMKHVAKVEDVGIEVHGIDAIGLVTRDVLERHVPVIVNDGHGLHVVDLALNVLFCAIMVPVLRHALCSILEAIAPRP